MKRPRGCARAAAEAAGHGNRGNAASPLNRRGQTLVRPQARFAAHLSKRTSSTEDLTCSFSMTRAR